MTMANHVNHSVNFQGNQENISKLKGAFTENAYNLGAVGQAIPSTLQYSNRYASTHESFINMILGAESYQKQLVAHENGVLNAVIQQRLDEQAYQTFIQCDRVTKVGWLCNVFFRAYLDIDRFSDLYLEQEDILAPVTLVFSEEAENTIKPVTDLLTSLSSNVLDMIGAEYMAMVKSRRVVDRWKQLHWGNSGCFWAGFSKESENELRYCGTSKWDRTNVSILESISIRFNVDVQFRMMDEGGVDLIEGTIQKAKTTYKRSSPRFEEVGTAV